MSTVSSFLFTAGHVLGAGWELLRYALRLGWALLLPRAVLAARLLAAESQLAIELNRSGGSRRRRRQFTPAFRLLWVALPQVSGWLGELGSRDEARDGKGLAHDRLPSLLALALPTRAAADSG
jgi:hypothetical protein